MKALLLSWPRRITLLALFSVVSIMCMALQAFASIDIRDLDNSDAINVQVTEERTRIYVNTRSGHGGSRTHVRTQLPSDADPTTGRAVTGNDARHSTRRTEATFSCYMWGAACTVPLPINDTVDEAPDDAPLPAAGPAPALTEPVEIVITTSDLLELIPSTPQILMDRGPFGLKNAHTNFYSSDYESQTVTQTMFGQEVTIVATPVEYHWDYGDGNTLVTDSPGRPVDVFNTETETSHQYTEPGLYTVILTTVFEGTYQVDGGPIQAVSSTVTQQADPIEIEIWRAVTRNVDQTCGQSPQAWGC